MTEQNYALVRDSATLIEGTGKEPPRPLHSGGKPKRTSTPDTKAKLLQLLAEFNHLPERRGVITQLSKKYGIHRTDVGKFLATHAPRTVADLPNETWRAIDGYEGQYADSYAVSSLGRVKRVLNANSARCSREKLLFGQIHSTGYLCVMLHSNGENKNRRVHRLLALAFIPNPNNLPMVNHKDGDKLNNDLSNLEWCTAQENTAHAFKTGLIVRKKQSTSPTL